MPHPIPGSCGSCCGGQQSVFPDPRAQNRQGAGGTIRNGVVHRRATFFNRSLHHMSLLIQQPGQMRFWEAVVVVFTVYALYRGFFSVQDLGGLLFRADMGMLCRGQNAVMCAFMLMLRMGFVIWAWAGKVVPWGFVAAVVAFVGEEVVATLKRRSAARQ